MLVGGAEQPFILHSKKKNCLKAEPAELLLLPIWNMQMTRGDRNEITFQISWQPTLSRSLSPCTVHGVPDGKVLLYKCASELVTTYKRSRANVKVQPKASFGGLPSSRTVLNLSSTSFSLVINQCTRLFLLANYLKPDFRDFYLQHFHILFQLK